MLQDWLTQRKVKKLVVVLTSVETKEVLERWEFKVEYETKEEEEEATKENGQENGNTKYKVRFSSIHHFLLNP